MLLLLLGDVTIFLLPTDQTRNIGASWCRNRAASTAAVASEAAPQIETSSTAPLSMPSPAAIPNIPPVPNFDGFSLIPKPKNLQCDENGRNCKFTGSAGKNAAVADMVGLYVPVDMDDKGGLFANIEFKNGKSKK